MWQLKSIDHRGDPPASQLQMIIDDLATGWLFQQRERLQPRRSGWRRSTLAPRHQSRTTKQAESLLYLKFIFYFFDQLNKSNTFELIPGAINSSES